MRKPDIDKDLALAEFTSSQLYRNLVVSQDGDLSAIQVTIEPNSAVTSLGDKRQALREALLDAPDDQALERELADVERAYDIATRTVNAERAALVAAVRSVADNYRGETRIFVGGVPMIAADMLDFVQDDLVTFGSAIVVVMVLMLALIFRDYRWVVVPITGCVLTATLMPGFWALPTGV